MGTAPRRTIFSRTAGLRRAVYSGTGGALQLAQRAGLPISQQTIDETAARNAALTEGTVAAIGAVVDPFRAGRAGINALRGRPAAATPPPIDAVSVPATAAPFSTPAISLRPHAPRHRNQSSRSKS